MFRKFLPLLIGAGVVVFALFPTSAVMQSKPDEPEGQLIIFNPLAPPAMAQPDAPTKVEVFDVNAAASAENRTAAQQGDTPAAASQLRISQLYTRGGEAGATYSQDFIEIFNSGNTTINIQGWRIVVFTKEGTTDQSIGVIYPDSFSVTPGMHLLVRFKGNGTNGQALNGLLPIVNDISLGSTSGRIFLVSPTQSVPGPGTCPATVGPTGEVSDMLGYGSSTCAEGSPVAVPPSNKSQTRINGGCTDTDNNASDYSLLDPNPRNFQAGVTPCGAQPTPTPTPSPTPTASPTPTPSGSSQFNFAQSQFEVFAGPAKITITVTRSGNTSTPATVDFATSDGTATAGSDYVATSGTLNFPAGDTQETFQIPLIDDSIPEPDETVNLTLSKPTGNGTLGSVNKATLLIHDNDTPNPQTPPIRISQVYSGGGEPGATYNRDFIELFNADPAATIDLQGWSLVITDYNSSGQATSIGAQLTSSVPLKPGQHVILSMPGTGTNGQALNAQFLLNAISLSNDGAQIFLIPKDKFPNVFTCPSVAPDPRGIVADFVGYGIATCFSGNVSPIPAPNQALIRINGGCTDTFSNADDFALGTPNPHNFASAPTPCGPQPTSTIQFSAAQYNVTEGSGAAHINLTRTGDLSAAAAVDYLTTDGTASERSDYNRTAGTIRFGVGESQKTIDVLITDDTLQEPTETVSIDLGKVTGNGVLGTNKSATLMILDNDGSSSTTNPVDASPFFVDEHYHDFLNRVPDSSGLQFWINNIESCTFVTTCREVKRIDTSAAFFLSIEFQNTGFEVYRAYKAAFPDSAQRPRGMVRYREFMRDTQAISKGVIVGNAGYEALLESNKRTFFQNFVATPEFVAQYPGLMLPADFVDALNAHTGNLLTATERNNLVNGMLALTETRATVVRKVAENQAFTNIEFNRAFVLMQYFGYLRRNVDDPPDKDFSGFDFWLGKLNQFNGDFKAAEMVKAFITSTEYRQRFGPVTGPPPGP